MLVKFSLTSQLTIVVTNFSMVNMSSSNQSTPRSTLIFGTGTSQAHFPRSTIDDFREIIREQSFILPNSSSSTDYETMEVPVKKYPPLPDINGATLSSAHAASFYRTETDFTTSNKSVPGRKQMFYHFARTQRGHLPSLNPNLLPSTFSNVMDLDENLPECYTRIPNRVQTYTSPNDRLSSPIKRPSAPSPPTSAHIKRTGHNAFVHRDSRNEDEDQFDSETDDLESQIFEENFYRYQQQSKPKFSNLNNNQPDSLLIYDDPSSTFSTLDLQ